MQRRRTYLGWEIQNVKADPASFVDVWMVNFCLEQASWGLHGVAKVIKNQEKAQVFRVQVSNQATKGGSQTFRGRCVPSRQCQAHLELSFLIRCFISTNNNYAVVRIVNQGERSSNGAKFVPASKSTMLSPTGQQETPGGGADTNLDNSALTRATNMDVAAMVAEWELKKVRARGRRVVRKKSGPAKSP